MRPKPETMPLRTGGNTLLACSLPTTRPVPFEEGDRRVERDPYCVGCTIGKAAKTRKAQKMGILFVTASSDKPMKATLPTIGHM